MFLPPATKGVRITMVPFYSDYLPARPTIDVLDECKLINVRQTPFDNLLTPLSSAGLILSAA